MSVRLIALTCPMVDDCQTPADVVSYCARVSNPANQANRETAPRLLKYLTKNQHWSPFEMASMTLEIATTRDIARQILRHRSFSFQEFSQRYAVVEEPAVYRQARMQDTANRQNSIEATDHDLQQWWADVQDDVMAVSSRAYLQAVANGIAKEVARAVLPEGLTKSTLYMAGTIRSWIHYVQLRGANGTQKEHRAIAEACKGILLHEFPDLAEVL